MATGTAQRRGVVARAGVLRARRGPPAHTGPKRHAPSDVLSSTPERLMACLCKRGRFPMNSVTCLHDLFKTKGVFQAEHTLGVDHVS